MNNSKMQGKKSYISWLVIAALIILYLVTYKIQTKQRDELINEYEQTIKDEIIKSDSIIKSISEKNDKLEDTIDSLNVTIDKEDVEQDKTNDEYEKEIDAIDDADAADDALSILELIDTLK